MATGFHGAGRGSLFLDGSIFRITLAKLTPINQLAPSASTQNPGS